MRWDDLGDKKRSKLDWTEASDNGEHRTSRNLKISKNHAFKNDNEFQKLKFTEQEH